MNKPNQRDQESSYKEHDGLLFDNSETMRVEILKSDSLDCQSHDRSGEEHS